MNHFVKHGKKIVAVARNYLDHCAELGNITPSVPIIFMKPTSCYLEEGKQSILIPRGCTVIHHEVELGIVIDKTCKNISMLDAMSYVAGYVLALDMTARDFQEEAKVNGNPWTLSKCFDTALPISRFIKYQEIEDPHNVNIWCKVNGELKQNGSTSDMIFRIPFLLSYISSYFTLEPGDVVLTGTPSGVGPVYSGDKITAGLDNLLEISFTVGQSLAKQ